MAMTSRQKRYTLGGGLAIAIAICTLIGFAYKGMSVVKREFRHRVRRVVVEVVKEDCVKQRRGRHP